MKINKKVSLVCALRIMECVYNPLTHFYVDMKSRGYVEYTALVNNFCLVGHDKALQQDIDWFKDVQMSFTINNVAKDIVTLYETYHKKFGDNFLISIAQVLSHIFKDMNL